MQSADRSAASDLNIAPSTRFDDYLVLHTGQPLARIFEWDIAGLTALE